MTIDRQPSRACAKATRGAAARASRKPDAGRRASSRRAPPPPNIFRRAWENMQGWLLLRRPLMSLTALLMIAAFVTALFVGGTVTRSLASNPILAGIVDGAGFGISNVHLYGNKRTPPESILAALGFEPGQSIFDADVHAARARLMKLDWVADADVRRRYPDDISVRVFEKLPFALWQAPDGKLWVVQRDGSLITTTGVSEFKHLPLLVGDGGSNAADIVDAVAQHRAVLARVRAYQRVSDRRWNLILDDGVVVKLPELKWQPELDTLERLIIDKGILERDVVEIDLRSPTQYFFVLKSGEKKNEPRGNAA